VSANGRSVNLLKIDHSGGAHDISYDAYNVLVNGQSARDAPVQGGGIAATWENVPMSECMALIKEPSGKLAFAGPNSMNTISSCPAGTWVGDNHALYNIMDMQCRESLPNVKS
jgi:pyrrolidone-carboxylate peptidase